MSVEKCLVMSHTLSGKTVELKRAVKKEDMSGSGGMGMGGMGMGGGGYGMGGGAGGPVRGNKQPDWMCKDCGNKNFGWREICNRCQIPKPAGGGMEVSVAPVAALSNACTKCLRCLSMSVAREATLVHWGRYLSAICRLSVTYCCRPKCYALTCSDLLTQKLFEGVRYKMSSTSRCHSNLFKLPEHALISSTALKKHKA